MYSSIRFRRKLFLQFLVLVQLLFSLSCYAHRMKRRSSPGFDGRFPPLTVSEDDTPTIQPTRRPFSPSTLFSQYTVHQVRKHEFLFLFLDIFPNKYLFSSARCGHRFQ
jgi:hypothetical protein